jgi:Beta-lactamase superfamily domain
MRMRASENMDDATTRQDGGNGVGMTLLQNRRRWLSTRLLGIGAMNSPRYRPAGLLIAWSGRRVAFDGGGAAVPGTPVDAWLVTDDRAELIADIRRHARELHVAPTMGDWSKDAMTISALDVVHTSHRTVGYLIEAHGRRAVWAPEFWRFPPWAAGADLMFADAAGWHQPIRFVGGSGGHASVTDTARQALDSGVRRLVFAHIGRPSIKARDAGLEPKFGQWGVEGRSYRLPVGPGTAQPGHEGETSPLS